MTGSFLLKNDARYGCSSKHHGVDLDQASRLFGIIRELDNNRIQELVYEKKLILRNLNIIIFEITTNLLFFLQIFSCISDSLIPSFVNLSSTIISPESLRIYLILPLYHGFANPLNCNVLHKPFCKAVLALKPEVLEIVTNWWLTAPSHYFERLVRVHKSVVLHYVKQSKPNKVLIVNYFTTKKFLKYVYNTLYFKCFCRVYYGM